MPWLNNSSQTIVYTTILAAGTGHIHLKLKQNVSLNTKFCYITY